MTQSASREDLGTEEEPATEAAQHPFAHFVRTVGRGATLSRPLTQDEAAEAMGLILTGRVEPVQIGALLLVLRYRKETPEELAGFVRAARAIMAPRSGAPADLDWPSYADRHKQLPYFLLAALLLAQHGVRVLMHGIDGQGPVTTPRALAAFGIAPSPSPGEAAAALEARNVAYLPLQAFCPELERLFALRPLLGVRSPANTFARELNPFDAPAQLQGVFHPTYLLTHQETGCLLGQPHAAIFKGGGGEVQRNPAKPCRIARLRGGVASEAEWPALTPEDRYAWREDPLDPARLLGFWRGDWSAPAPEAAVVGTVAIALDLLGRATGPEEAETMASELWRSRRRDLF